MFIFFRLNLLPDNYFKMNLFPNPLAKNAWYVLIGRCAIMHFTSSLLNLKLMYSLQAKEKDHAQWQLNCSTDLHLVYYAKERKTILSSF